GDPVSSSLTPVPLGRRLVASRTDESSNASDPRFRGDDALYMPRVIRPAGSAPPRAMPTMTTPMFSMPSRPMVKRAAFWIMSIAITEPAVANEVSNFTYDELGRSIGVTKTGTINNGQAVLVQYDPAGNRQGYAVGGVGGNANLPGLSISDPTVMEGAGAQLVFVITLSAPVATAVTVNFATSDGTAIAGQDYVSKSGYLIFSPGETSKSVAVDVINDGILEPDENLSVDISNSSAAYIAKSKGRYEIFQYSKLSKY
ncbi:hypothetical protein OY671_007892, partial [Metschnikowia pulcherrima]